MKFDKIHLRWVFSTTVNDNDNIIDIQKYRHIRAVYLISYIQRGNGTDTALHRMYSCYRSNLFGFEYVHGFVS